MVLVLVVQGEGVGVGGARGGVGEALIPVLSCWCSTEVGHGVSGVLEAVCWYVPGLVDGLWAAPLGDVALTS